MSRRMPESEGEAFAVCRLQNLVSRGRQFGLDSKTCGSGGRRDF